MCVGRCWGGSRWRVEGSLTNTVHLLCYDDEIMSLRLHDFYDYDSTMTFSLHISG